jgi:quercetin dioxygenase-like cupin family protein
MLVACRHNLAKAAWSSRQGSLARPRGNRWKSCPLSSRTPPLPDQIEDPHSGQRVVFRRIEPEVLEVDLYLKPGAFVREHIHLSQEETFAVVAGALVLDVGGERRTVAAGFTEVVPPRKKHGFDPVAGEAQLLVTIRPALDLAGYFRDFLTLSRDGRLRIPEKGLPKPLLLFAMLMHRYRREIAAPGIPVWLQRPVWRMLAWLGQLRGLKL